jgi:hypothetical protein
VIGLDTQQTKQSKRGDAFLHSTKPIPDAPAQPKERDEPLFFSLIQPAACWNAHRSSINTMLSLGCSILTPIQRDDPVN